MRILSRMARGVPLRRRVAALLPLVLGVCALGAYVGWSRWQRTYDPAELARIRTTIEQEVRRWVAEGDLARDDGFVYAVDVAQLMEHAARVGDDALFTALRDYAVAHLVLDREDDPYTRGFVAWRHRPGVPPDASGTTEALRLARALWLGAAPADRALARRVLDGYVRHAAIDHDVWMVRNYFNLGTRAFANDSFLIDYDPDLLRQAAAEDPALEDAAARSLDLVRRARAPSGLLYSMIQGDVRTLMPRLDLSVFSPNDVVQLNNACTVAETVTGSAPEIARGVLDFAYDARRPLRRYFRGRDGEPVGETRAEITSLTCLARLAARLGDARAAAHFGERAVWHWRTFAEGWQAPRAYTASEVLLAIDALLAAPRG